jgi:hypothetical protein
MSMIVIAVKELDFALYAALVQCFLIIKPTLSSMMAASLDFAITSEKHSPRES